MSYQNGSQLSANLTKYFVSPTHGQPINYYKLAWINTQKMKAAVKRSPSMPHKQGIKGRQTTATKG